jgi:transposase-like protein
MAKATRAEWVKRVERWQDSGLTAKEFAAELDVSPNSLTFWKWKLGRERSAPKANATKAPQSNDVTTLQFLQLVPTQDDAPSSPASLELVIRHDLVVRVPRGFDEETLTRVVRVLGGS